MHRPCRDPRHPWHRRSRGRRSSRRSRELATPTCTRECPMGGDSEACPPCRSFWLVAEMSSGLLLVPSAPKRAESLLASSSLLSSGSWIRPGSGHFSSATSPPHCAAFSRIVEDWPLAHRWTGEDLFYAATHNIPLDSWLTPVTEMLLRDGRLVSDLTIFVTSDSTLAVRANPLPAHAEWRDRQSKRR